MNNIFNGIINGDITMSSPELFKNHSWLTGYTKIVRAGFGHRTEFLNSWSTGSS